MPYALPLVYGVHRAKNTMMGLALALSIPRSGALRLRDPGCRVPRSRRRGKGAARLWRHQASPSAAVEANSESAVLALIAAFRRVAYYLDRWARLAERDEREFLNVINAVTPARLGAERSSLSSQGGDAKPRHDLLGCLPMKHRR
jgi:hypothetical protein